MSGGKEEARTKSDNVVVVTGGYILERDVNGGPGGRSDKGGRRYRRNRNCDGQLIKWGGYCSKHNLRDRA